MDPVVEVIVGTEHGEGPHWDIPTQSLYFVDLALKTINRYIPTTKTHTKAHLDSIPDPVVEVIIENMELGEGPHWDIATQSLYFVDLGLKTINRYVPSTKTHTKAYLDVYPSFIIPVDGEREQFVVGVGCEIAIVTWDGKSENVQELKLLCDIGKPGPKIEYRLNDGKCDSSGRLWTGNTLGWDMQDPHSGSIFSFGPDLKNHNGKISCSNGLTWSKDNKKFFHIDSYKNTVDRYDFDIATGEITNREILFSFEKHNLEGFPDGMTIDEDDNLWVAGYMSSCIIKIDSRKPETLLYTLKLSAHQVSSMAWGGPNLDELYVTSGKITLNGIVRKAPEHGSMYRITGLGTKGLPMSNFKFSQPTYEKETISLDLSDSFSIKLSTKSR